MSFRLYTLLIFTVIYRTPTKNGACAINNGNSVEYHELCSSLTADTSECEAYCTNDILCKGYASYNLDVLTGCEFATVSDCPSDYDKYFQGQVGDLLLDSNLNSDGYAGCFIKTIGIRVHFIHKH